MQNEFNKDERGAHNLPLIILFGVVLASFMAFIFISIYNQQLIIRVDEQAEALANDLAQAAFDSLTGGQSILPLPKDLGGSPYSITVQDNSVFTVIILGGWRSGSSYSAVVNAIVSVENENFLPGGHAFFMRSGDEIIVSASPIEARSENIVQVTSTEPPSFYYFSKQDPKGAAAIAAVYFYAKTHYPSENIDNMSYRWENGNSLLARVRRGSEYMIIRVTGIEDRTRVGVIENAWIVENLENFDEIESSASCPSPDNAYLSGWLYSPQAVLNHLRSRTWYRTSDNAVVVIPVDAIVQASAVTTNVSTYPAWRVRFENYTIYYRMLPWWEYDDTPGFLFQSDPELTPII